MDILIGAIGGNRGVILGTFNRVAPFVPFWRGQWQSVVEHGVEAIHERHLGHNGPKATIIHIGNRPHQQPACTAPLRHNAPARGEAFGDQVIGGGQKVGEAVHLVCKLAMRIPAIALVFAPANMRDGINKAAIHERQSGGRKARWNGNAISAIAVKP